MTTLLLRPGHVVKLTRAVSAPGQGIIAKELKLEKEAAIESVLKFSTDDLKVNVFGKGLQISRGLTSTLQVRWAHTDIHVPDFTEYRRDSTKDPTKRNLDTEDERKLFTYMTYGIGGVLGLYVTKDILHKVVAIKGPSAAALAMANTEINLANIPEGKWGTFTWRGKPVFVRHRTAEEIERERAVNLNELRDPQHDTDRVKKPEWLVLIGICTHLGCVPIAGIGDYGGYYCPCHGSHYDASGRVRRGPAPLNLEVPDYSFPDDNTVLIGEA